MLDISYQSIPSPLLQDYLGEMGEESLAALVKDCGWSLQGEGGVVSIRNQETSIRPKKILAKIEFDSEWAWSSGRGLKSNDMGVIIVEGCS